VTGTDRRALDCIEIQQVLARYCRGIDRLDKALLESVYWEDGYDDHVLFAGKPNEFIDWVLEYLSHDKSTAHLLGQSLIEVTGNSANVETYFLAHHVRIVDQDQFVASSQGRYLDKFERRNEEWRILSRCVILDIRRRVPFGLDPGLPPSVPARNIGRRGEEDFTYSALSGL
jgi:hypothetical protein